jgi:TldD protein
MTSRRDFLRASGTALGAAGALALTPGLLRAAPAPGRAAAYTDPATRDLLLEALDAARRAGASWADVRISRNRNNSVQTRERQITDVVDTDTMGCGVRVLVDGTWGFCATQELTRAGVGAAAQEAVAIAKANRVAVTGASSSRRRRRTPRPRGAAPTSRTRSPCPSSRRPTCCCARTPRPSRSPACAS